MIKDFKNQKTINSFTGYPKQIGNFSSYKRNNTIHNLINKTKPGIDSISLSKKIEVSKILEKKTANNVLFENFNEKTKKKNITYGLNNDSKVLSLNSSFNKESKKKQIFINKEDNASLLIKAELIDFNRKIIKEIYIKSGKSKAGIIKKWIEILKIMKYFDVILYIHCFKILGDIYLEFDDYENAKINYLCHKYLAYRLEFLNELMIAYESLGHVYKFLYQYHQSIKCFKKQIEIAWVLNNTRSELIAYDNIGIQYFYLGNRDKAKYYHNRMMNGIVESETHLKRKIIEQFKEKNFNFFVKDEKEIEMLKPTPKNEESNKNLNSIFELFSEREFEIETNLQEGLKISNISESDITFTIMSKSEFLNYSSDLEDSNIEEDSFSSKRQISIAYGRKIRPGFNNSKKLKITNVSKNIKDKEGNLADNMILSHLSLKRKDQDCERFDKIFEQFNKNWIIVKKTIGIMK